MVRKPITFGGISITQKKKLATVNKYGIN